MFTGIIVSKVRKALDDAGFATDGEFVVLGVNGDVWTLTLYKGNDSYVVKYCDNSDECFDYRIYNVLEKYGIKMNEYVVKNNRLNICKSDCFENGSRLLSEEDLSNKTIVECLGRWYKKLHSVNVEDVGGEAFHLEQQIIIKIMNYYKLNNHRNLIYICNNIDNIRLKYGRVHNGVLCCCFPLDYLMISSDFKEVFLKDCSCIKTGVKNSDTRDLLDRLSDDCKKVFVDAYGKISEYELILARIVSDIFDLYRGIIDKNVSEKIAKCLEDICGDEFYDKVRELVEWY